MQARAEAEDRQNRVKAAQPVDFGPEMVANPARMRFAVGRGRWADRAPLWRVKRTARDARAGGRVEEAWHRMNETTDLEQIAALEHRITTALDRIARGVAARTAAPAPAAAADTSELEERLAALSAALEETQAALQSEQSANADLNERLRAVESARQADADQASRDIAALQEQVNTAPEAPPEDDGPGREELLTELTNQREVESVLRRRIARLREERKTSRTEYNEARERLEEVEGKLDQLQALAAASAPSESGELARLRESNRVLRDTIEELREAMAALPEAQKELIEKAYFGDFTQSEIAAQTGLPLGTIKSRIRLALDRLRHAMQ